MFTGIINGRGKISTIKNNGKEIRFTIDVLFPLVITSIGESIAVNGVCLTIEYATNNTFTVYSSHETIQCTNLGKLEVGNYVNLEQAIAIGDRLGGHLVTGHVDCIATVQHIKKNGESHTICLTFPSMFGKEVVSKGSIALDGISLTVNDCGDDFLEVNIIPKTWHITTIAEWTIGNHINMETDIIAKYVHKMLQPILASTTPNNNKSNVTLEFLQEHGFF